jgi:hypothetical protein
MLLAERGLNLFCLDGVYGLGQLRSALPSLQPPMYDLVDHDLELLPWGDPPRAAGLLSDLDPVISFYQPTVQADISFANRPGQLT